MGACPLALFGGMQKEPKRPLCWFVFCLSVILLTFSDWSGIGMSRFKATLVDWNHSPCAKNAFFFLPRGGAFLILVYFGFCWSFFAEIAEFR